MMAGDTSRFFIGLRKRTRKEDDDDKVYKQGSFRSLQLTNSEQILTPNSLRDRLLQREVMELNPEVLPITVCVVFPDANVLHEFLIRVTPNEGMWKHGTFEFSVVVPDDYNMSPPKVRCQTPIWHPNIAFPGGQVCLSLLRVAPLDNMGWTPTRRLKDVVLGLDALFGDLVNFEDPLNQDAADMYLAEPSSFASKVKEFIRRDKPLLQNLLKTPETCMATPRLTPEPTLPF